MQNDPEFDAFIVERNAALAALDMDYARRMMPDATDDYVRLLVMHKARYETTTMPRELRHESAEWLRSRGSCRMSGLPILPEGELPQ